MSQSLSRYVAQGARWWTIAAVLAVAGCGGGGSSDAPPAAQVPTMQAPTGEKVVTASYSISTDAALVLGGQPAKVFSLVGSSDGISGQLSADATNDVLGVMKGDDIVLLAPVLNGKQQTATISFESTALQIVLMNLKFSGSTTAIREAAVPRIMAHAKFADLVAQVKVALDSGFSRPLDTFSNPQLYTLADEIAGSISLDELATPTVGAVASFVAPAYQVAATVGSNLIAPAYANDSVLNGRQYVSAALSNDQKQLKFTNNSMVAFAAFDASTNGDDYAMLDPSDSALKTEFKFSDLKEWPLDYSKFISLNKKETAVDLANT